MAMVPVSPNFVSNFVKPSGRVILDLRIKDGYAFRAVIKMLLTELKGSNEGKVVLNFSANELIISEKNQGGNAIHNVLIDCQKCGHYFYDPRDSYGNLFATYPISLTLVEFCQVVEHTKKTEGIQMTLFENNNQMWVVYIANRGEGSVSSPSYANFNDGNFADHRLPNINYYPYVAGRITCGVFADFCKRISARKAKSITVTVDIHGVHFVATDANNKMICQELARPVIDENAAQPMLAIGHINLNPISIPAIMSTGLSSVAMSTGLSSVAMSTGLSSVAMAAGPPTTAGHLLLPPLSIGLDAILSLDSLNSLNVVQDQLELVMDEEDDEEFDLMNHKFELSAKTITNLQKVLTMSGGKNSKLDMFCRQDGKLLRFESDISNYGHYIVHIRNDNSGKK